MCPMRRPQLILRALLVSMLAVGGFFGGLATERYRAKRKAPKAAPVDIVVGFHVVDPEGFIGDLAKKAKAASQEQHKAD